VEAHVSKVDLSITAPAATSTADAAAAAAAAIKQAEAAVQKQPQAAAVQQPAATTASAAAATKSAVADSEPTGFNTAGASSSSSSSSADDDAFVQPSGTWSAGLSRDEQESMELEIEDSLTGSLSSDVTAALTDVFSSELTPAETEAQSRAAGTSSSSSVSASAVVDSNSVKDKAKSFAPWDNASPSSTTATDLSASVLPYTAPAAATAPAASARPAAVYADSTASGGAFSGTTDSCVGSSDDNRDVKKRGPPSRGAGALTSVDNYDVKDRAKSFAPWDNASASSATATDLSASALPYTAPAAATAASAKPAAVSNGSCTDGGASSGTTDTAAGDVKQRGPPSGGASALTSVDNNDVKDRAKSFAPWDNASPSSPDATDLSASALPYTAAAVPAAAAVKTAAVSTGGAASTTDSAANSAADSSDDNSDDDRSGPPSGGVSALAGVDSNSVKDKQKSFAPWDNVSSASATAADLSASSLPYTAPAAAVAAAPAALLKQAAPAATAASSGATDIAAGAISSSAASQPVDAAAVARFEASKAAPAAARSKTWAPSQWTPTSAATAASTGSKASSSLQSLYSADAESSDIRVSTAVKPTAATAQHNNAHADTGASALPTIETGFMFDEQVSCSYTIPFV
jgi:trimeric autotransporter adhesin